MKTRLLILFASFTLLSIPQVFGCSKDMGVEVLFPWYADTGGDCSVRGYSISLAGILYIAIGAVFVVVWRKRK